MSEKNILKQYHYDTEVLGINHKESLDLLLDDFPIEEIEIIEQIYIKGYQQAKEDYY